MSKTIAISGAGLVGSLWAVYLAQQGYNVDVYERRRDMRKQEVEAGRSINLALSDRGWKALEGVGLEAEVRKLAIPMYGRLIHDEEGNTNLMPYGKGEQAIFSVSRGGLNELLMDAAEKTGRVNLIFNQRTEEVDLEQASITIKDENSGKVKKKEHEVIFGADGAFSAARLSLMKTDRVNYSQFYIDHGYKELTIPAGETDKWRIEKNALHIWPRKNFMLIALPNLDGSFTVTLFLAFEGEDSFANLNTEEEVGAFFKKYFPDAVPHMPTLMEDFFSNPTSSLVTVRTDPWHHKDKVLLIGDAAHAIVPFYGQGMNAGFEDCTILNGILEKNPGDWKKIFSEMSRVRVEDANAISELALRNFIEMRDLVADPHFIQKRELSRKINDLLPERWIPLYSMVTFTHLPYAVALKRGDRQNKIMEDLLRNFDLPALLEDEDHLKKLIEEHIEDYW